MRIGLQTWGSEGDVRPFIALAAGLSKSGHEVTLVITSLPVKNYSEYCDNSGFNVRHACESYKDWTGDFISQTQQRIMESNPLKRMDIMNAVFFDPAVKEMYGEAIKLCDENDIVIGHFLLHPLQTAALKKNIPYGTIQPCPGLYPTRYNNPPGTISFGKGMNPWLWKVAKKLMNKESLKYPNALRHTEGVPAAADLLEDVWQSKTLTLIASSPTLFDRPADWNKNLQITGPFYMAEKNDGWTMPPELEDFIAQGGAPVYITLGFCAPVALHHTIELFCEAVKISRCRAIIQAPLEAASSFNNNPDIYFIARAPHQQVFPRCALVIHHGGAGTTHSATLAGCPSIVIDHFFDQYFWGDRLVKIGLSKKVFRRASLKAHALGKVIRATLDSASVKQKAAELSRSMKNEADGVQQAVKLIEQVFGSKDAH